MIDFNSISFDAISFTLGVGVTLLLYLLSRYTKSFKKSTYSIPHLKATVESIHLKLESISKELNILYKFFNEVGDMK